MVTAGRFSYHGAADDEETSPTSDKIVNITVITVNRCHVRWAIFDTDSYDSDTDSYK